MKRKLSFIRQCLAATLAAVILSNSAAFAQTRPSNDVCVATSALDHPTQPSAGAVTILQVCQNDKRVTSATIDVQSNIAVAVATPTPVTAGQRFNTPARFITPADVTLDVYSANGNLQRIGSHTTILQIIGKFGEAFNLAAGQLSAFVTNRLSFYTVQSLNVTAASRGTIFVVDARPNVSVTFSISEGKLALSRTVTIRLAAEGRTIDGIRETDTITPTGTATITYPVPFPIYKEFKNADDARSYFRDQLATAEASGDELGVENSLQNIDRLNGIAPEIGPPDRGVHGGHAASPGLSGTDIGLIAVGVVVGGLVLAGGGGKGGSGTTVPTPTTQTGTIGLQSHARHFAFQIPIRL